MQSRRFACLVAAGVIGLGLASAASDAAAAPQRDVVVKGKAIDPETQAVVYFGDLDLAFQPGQRMLVRRISRTAYNLCANLNPGSYIDECADDAVASTDDQVGEAILRAKRKLAGLPTGPMVAISMVLGGR